jgi:carbamoyltransferase
VPYKKIEAAKLPATAAGLIAGHKVIGWFQGRMEFGPRALGGRSIIGDARDPEMQKTMNVKIKFRESFRPFAPTVMYDRTCDYFECDRESPYMLLTAYVRPECRLPADAESSVASGLDKLKVLRSTIPAITHVDYSARLQTVNPIDNRLYYEMVAEFEKLTGCPVIINTSFNVRGEPIVCSPEDAYRCFMRTNMDYLFLGPFLLDKTEQPEIEEKEDWRAEFPPD